MPTDPSEALSEAFAHYRAGRLHDVERSCRLALEQDPRCAVAWNLLGVVAYSGGNFESSLSHFATALKMNPREADFCGNVGMAHQALGRAEQAIQFFRQSLALNPSVAATHDNLGNCLHTLQRYDEAIASRLRAIALDPTCANPHNNLGNSYLELGQVDEATAAFHRAIELAPNYAAAHNNLGTAHLRQSEFAAAERHFQRAIELQPRLAEAYNNLGVVCKKQGDLRRAAGLFEQALQLRPRYGEALNNLGTVLGMLEEYDRAIERFRQAVEVEPDSAGNHDRLGNALRLGGRLEEARACFDRALQLDPRLASAHAHWGATWHECGEMGQAIACYRRALELDPQYYFAHTSLAQVLVSTGQPDAALAHVQQAIAIEPQSAVAYWLLAANGSRSLDEPSVRQIEQLLADGRRSDQDRSYLHFALAQSFDKAGDYDRAMAHARQANDLKKLRFERLGRQFDRAAHIARIDELTALYTRDLFAAAGVLGTESEVPVFVVGMPRSGTTLVEQILASHSRVHGAGELDDMQHAELSVREICKAGMLRSANWTNDEIARAQGVARAYLDRLAHLGGPATRVVDKMPTNFLCLGTIAALFPHARVIHCVRDPRDVLLSCYFQNFSSDAMNFTFDWDDLTLYWQQYQRLMGHWRSVLPLPIHEVRYEELVRDQERVSRTLVESCGLAWEPGCLEFHKTPRTVTTASAHQVREPIYTQSVARWRNYGPHLDWILPGQSLPS